MVVWKAAEKKQINNKTMRYKMINRTRFSTCVIVLVALAAIAATEGEYCNAWSDGPLNKACGSPPPAGLCSGLCDKITYSGPGGGCQYDGGWWDSCDSLTPTFTITETHSYYWCDFDVYPGTSTYYCKCSDREDTTKRATQTKVCDCLP